MKKTEKAPLVDQKDSDRKVTIVTPKPSSNKFGWITGVLVRMV